MRSADFFVSFGRELRDDQISFFVWQKEAIPVLDQKRVCPARFLASRSRKRLPNPFARVRLKASQLSITANSVNITILDKWRRHDAVQRFGIPFALAFGLPDYDRRALPRLRLEHDRAVVKTGKEQLIARLSRGRNAQAVAGGKFLGPEKLSSFGIKRVNRLRMPEDE